MSCLFCFCHAKISLTMALHAMLLVSLESWGEPTWFETLWSYDVEANYQTMSSHVWFNLDNVPMVPILKKESKRSFHNCRKMSKRRLESSQS